MDANQQKFHEFLMSLVSQGHEAAAETILAKSFGQQDAGLMSPDAIDQVVAQLTPLLKPSGVVALQQAAAGLKEMAGQGDQGPSQPDMEGHRRGDAETTGTETMDGEVDGQPDDELDGRPKLTDGQSA